MAQSLGIVMRLHHTRRRVRTTSRGVSVGARFAIDARVIRSLLVAAALALFAPGCEVDCFDGGELEAKYQQGADEARRVNETQYAQGRQAGLALTRADGLADGDEDGYADGFLAGYYSGAGYTRGYSLGYSLGSNDGSYDASACSDGTSDGLAEGESSGFDDGSAAGYDEGWYVGYDQGWEAGAATCGGTDGYLRAAPPPSTETADTKDERTCRARGYNERVDHAAFDRGYDAGKLANPLYQSGYREAYPLAYAEGEAIGVDAGYADGYDDGYATGYDDSAFAIYDACYADAWDSGYARGYDDGWDSGVARGHSDGHAAGYEDGASCGT